jgi:hypothetical protein
VFEVGQPAQPRHDLPCGGRGAVVDEADDRQPVPRVRLQDLRQLHGNATAADQDGAVLGDPPLTTGGHQPARQDPPSNDEADGDRGVDQERRDGLLLVAQSRHRCHDGDRSEQPGDEGRQLVEHAQVKTSAVARTAGDQHQPEQRRDEVRPGLLRHPQCRGGQCGRVDR